MKRAVLYTIIILAILPVCAKLTDVDMAGHIILNTNYDRIDGDYELELARARPEVNFERPNLESEISFELSGNDVELCDAYIEWDPDSLFERWGMDFSLMAGQFKKQLLRDYDDSRFDLPLAWRTELTERLEDVDVSGTGIGVSAELDFLDKRGEIVVEAFETGEQNRHQVVSTLEIEPLSFIEIFGSVGYYPEILRSEFMQAYGLNTWEAGIRAERGSFYARTIYTETESPQARVTWQLWAAEFQAGLQLERYWAAISFERTDLKAGETFFGFYTGDQDRWDTFQFAASYFPVPEIRLQLAARYRDQNKKRDAADLLFQLQHKF